MKRLLEKVAVCAAALCAVAALALADTIDRLAPDPAAAAAQMETLNAQLLASRSATLTLEAWCKEHRLAGEAEAKIVARRLPEPAKPATAAQRQRLAVAPDEPLRFRHVQLFCGDRVLSEADNWYVPSRLTPAMNQALDTTDIPFGKAVRDLKPYRETFGAEMLWHPLSDGGEAPDALFEHRAVLYTADRQPFAEVREIYRRGVLYAPGAR